jgi:GxxExxY protein
VLFVTFFFGNVMHHAAEPLPQQTEEVARSIVDAALALHRALGPGLLESAYETCLAYELECRRHVVLKQVALPVVYQSVRLDADYRVDLMVDDAVIVEVKAVEALAPLHEAQLLTYLRLSRRRLGLLINFNVVLLKNGIKRMIL